MGVLPLTGVDSCPRLGLWLLSEPVSLGLQCRNVQCEDKLFEDDLRIGAQGCILAVSEWLELEGEHLDLDKGARALLHPLEHLDVGAQQDLRDQHVHRLEPEVELTLLEELLLPAIAASLKQSKDG